MKPSERDKGSYIKENFLPLFENGVLSFTKDKLFDDEIELIEVNGHTFWYAVGENFGFFKYNFILC
ncbi:MAG: hypothetical protein MZV64_20170 [Ignavibacteriales bacterium]|nr:hypothetical protein [Ignavibacteriales bacterium]